MTTQPVDEWESADEYVGAQINQLMFRRRMTRAQLGELLGIGGPAAGNKLRGSRSWTLDELILVGRHLEVPVSELLPGEDYLPIVAGRGRVGGSQYAPVTPNPRSGDLIDLVPFIERRAGLPGAGLPGAGLPGTPAKVFAIRRRVVFRGEEQAS